MSKIDLSPECVNALSRIQRNSDDYAEMLEEVCDFIIEWTDPERDGLNSAEAMSNIKNMRHIRKLILMLGYPSGVAENKKGGAI